MIIVDFHVHFHKRYNVNLFFNSIKKNFQSYCKKENFNTIQNVICLTESYRTNFFNELIQNSTNTNYLDNWTIDFTKNKNTLVLTHVSGFKLFVIAGRQIVTKENLELLGIGMTQEVEDGMQINEVVQIVNDNGLIPIIPWGFGKWTGNRRKIVRKILDESKNASFFLGDNGNRPWFMSISSLFKLGLQKGVFNLQGSDSLPFSREELRPGSFGNIIEGDLSEDYPFDDLIKLIKNDNVKINEFGKLESAFKFIKNQVAMQIVKRNR